MMSWTMMSRGGYDDDCYAVVAAADDDGLASSRGKSLPSQAKVRNSLIICFEDMR